MAFEKTKLTNEIEQLEEATRNAYDAIFNKGKPGYRMRTYKTDTVKYQEAKEKYDVLYPKYLELKEKNDKRIAVLQAEVSKLEEADKAAEKKKDTGGDLADAKDEYQRALDSQDPARIKTAKEELAAARTAYQQAGGNTTPASTSGETTTATTDANGNVVVGTDKYSAYTINADGTVSGAKGPVLFVEEKDAKGNIVSTPYETSANARAAFLKQYATPQAIKQLQADMLASGYIKQEDIASGQWAVKGLNDLLSAYTFKSVSDVKYGVATEPMGLTSFLKLKKAGSGTGQPTSFKTITTRGDAKRLLDQYLMDLIGAPSTDEEEDIFYKELNALENKAVRTYKDGVTTGSELDDASRLLLAAKVARKRLRNSDVDEILKSGVGSQVAIDISTLQKTAANYGVEMTAAEALKQVAAGVGQKDYIAKQQERVKLIGKQLYPNLAAHIDAGGTVADIADQYAYTKIKKLGVAVPVSTTDKDVMDAVNSGMSVADFNVALQKKPEWRMTEEAHTVADDFIGTMLKTFGLA